MKIAKVLKLFQFILNHPLNSKRKFKAIQRFLGWQLGSRLVPGPVAVDFVSGSKLLVSPGMTGATGNIYTGLHEFEDMAFVLHALRKGDTFVDVGANIGSYTILAGAAVGTMCLAFEPIGKTYNHLVQNINLNGISDHVEAFNIGVGDKEGTLQFTSELDTVNHVLTESEKSTKSVSVPVRPLDEVVGERQPTIIKIDVEGFETNVISGAHNILSADTLLAVLMELNGSGTRYGFDEAALHQKMLNYGFQPFTYSPFERKLIPLNGKNHQSLNTLYIKDIEKVGYRVKSSPVFHISAQEI